MRSASTASSNSADAAVSANAAILAVIVGISPSIILAAVLVLVADQGRPKAIALALGWFTALAAVAVISLVAAHDLHVTRGGAHAKVFDLLDIVGGLALVVAGVVWAVRVRRTQPKDPRWLQRLDSMPMYGAFILGAFLPPYVLVVAGVSEIVRHDRAAATRDLAALLFVVIGSIGAFTPVVIAFLARDPKRVLHRWRVWIVAHWRTVVITILIVGGAYLVAKGAIEWSHDRTTSSTPAAYRPRT